MGAWKPIRPALHLLIVAVNVALVQSRTCLSTNHTTEVWTKIEASLGSRVLLSCLYDPKLHLEAICNNTAVIWKKHGGQNLVEIKVSDSTLSFWASWSSRIEAFTSLAKTGNFSIALKTMNLEDVGNFSCSLYDGVNCMMGTQGISLALGTSTRSVDQPSYRTEYDYITYVPQARPIEVLVNPIYEMNGSGE